MHQYQSCSEKNCFFFAYANKGTDQPADLRSLISAFVVSCPDSDIPLNFFLLRAFVAMSPNRSENPEDRFSQYEADLGFPTRSDTNRAVQAQKMARSFKFLTLEVGGLYYL